MPKFCKKVSLITGLTVLTLIFGFMPQAFAETDVTSQLVVTRGRLMFDLSTNTSYLNISIANNSTGIFLTPIKIVVTNINPATITVANAPGKTETGAPCFELGVNRLPDGQLDPGDAVDSIKIAFNNKSRLRFTYGIQIMALLPSPEATIDRMTDALKNKNKDELFINLSASGKEYFEKNLDKMPDGSLDYLSQFINSATLIEETGLYRKYETQITLPTGEVIKTDFCMVFENGAWRLSEQ